MVLQIDKNAIPKEDRMTAQKFEEISEFLPCECACLEHHAHIGLTWWSRDNVAQGCQCTINIHLAPQSFWKRLVYAFKYLFQITTPSGSYDEVIINKNRAEKIKKLIEKYLALESQL